MGLENRAVTTKREFYPIVLKGMNPLEKNNIEKDERVFAYVSAVVLVLLILLTGLPYAGQGKHRPDRHLLKSEAR